MERNPVDGKRARWLSLDGGNWRNCSSPKVYERLSKGEHTFKVRAIDADGNIDPTPAVRTWRIAPKKR
jgi:large repetitive protein